MIRFIALYGGMYGAFGAASPFLPALLSSRGLSASDLGWMLGAATAARLIVSPIASRIADRIHGLRPVLALCVSCAALIAPGYLVVRDPRLLFAVLATHAMALAPITVLADALAVSAANRAGAGAKFEYGWVRGTGSAAFIAGTLLSGQAVGRFGLMAIVWLQSVLLAGAAIASTRVPDVPAAGERDSPRQRCDAVSESAREVGVGRSRGGAIGQLLSIAPFRNLVGAAALILGSHAMNDAFAMIRWTAAGISPGVEGVLWSESVAAEVAVFFFLGPLLLHLLSPAAALSVAAIAGIIRWAVMAQTSDVLAIALVQPLHGITFALLHLACMRMIARVAPRGLEGTAQAIYGTVGVGLATAIVTAASGQLYGMWGARAFWVMAGLCAMALPFIIALGRETPDVPAATV